MTVFHLFNCAILTFGPHAVYYSATPLSEYGTLGTSIKASVVYLATALVKLICLATFLKVSESDSFDPYQEFLKALIGFVDVAGLYFALTQLTHRNISQNHKFQAVGLGWAFADSVLHRLAPLWVGARGLEFTWEYILQGLEANANLVLSISLAALGSLMWLRKNKPKTLIPIIYLCAGIVATMPSITSYLKRGLGWYFPKVVGFELFTSLVMAFISCQLFSAALQVDENAPPLFPFPFDDDVVFSELTILAKHFSVLKGSPKEMTPLFVFSPTNEFNPLACTILLLVLVLELMIIPPVMF